MQTQHVCIIYLDQRVLHKCYPNLVHHDTGICSLITLDDHFTLYTYFSYDIGKVRLHRYICFWRASERKLGKKPVTKPKKTLDKSREQG